ncbi:Boudin [Paragonimus heterotremus]|uniref:Boudin n=1 Tax=Paragonimus heterotremus TaxID=100268 RepID=A0A8J4SSB4_9TREM|nr:Boudin [Paragonimus heterotremus]
MFVIYFLVFLITYDGIGVQGLSCYQCNSSVDSSCLEGLIDLGENSLRSRPCDTYGARFCIKTTGIYGAVMGTTRFCSSYDLGNECQYLPFPDHDRIYRACIFTCDTEGCNPATKLEQRYATPVVSLFLIGLLLKILSW